MPRSNRPSLEMAVASSAFFGLPLEIRIMIYKVLLHNSADILIPSNQFKRQRSSKVGIYQLCALCGRSFGRMESYMSHGYLGCGQSSNLMRWPKRPEQAPSLWPAFLRTCRLIHAEAAPLLYQSKTFRFEDAATPNCFRWSTDQAQAPLIESIHILIPRRGISRNTTNYHNRNPWWRYFMGSRFSLATDFPHLKGITVTLGKGLAVANAQDVRMNFELFAKHIYKLDWLQVIGLNDPTLLKYLYSVIERGDDDDGRGRKSVQTKITEYKECIGWKNAIIWWGLPGEEAPRKPIPYTGDRRVRNRLFRMVDENVVSYAAGQSFLDTGP